MIILGTWTSHSELDPRWNNSGHCYADFKYVPELEQWIEHCKKEYGTPPKDAIQSFRRDNY
jgi:hypothetical protein